MVGRGVVPSREVKCRLALAHGSVKLRLENLSAAVRRQLEVIDTRHHAGQILVAADALVVALTPHHRDWRLQALQTARGKGGIAGQEAQEQAALRFVHVLQHLERTTGQTMRGKSDGGD